MIRIHKERRVLMLENLANEQRERTFSRFELITLMLQFLDLRQDRFELGRLIIDLKTKFLRFENDVAPSSKIAHQHAPRITHQRRIDVLVALRYLLDRVDVRAALV